MNLSLIDILTFGGFFALVIGISLYKSREEETSEDYFLAGRGLGFWLIGFSLIASNISTEHFVGMAGSGFGNIGFAVASYEWMAAITLVFV
ncbi:MAG: solute:sodium symporter family transporter, partial [bacterium]